MVKRKPEDRWFIEPLDAHTNEALVRELPEENACAKEPNDKSSNPGVYLIELGMLSKFIASKADKRYKFNVFQKKGDQEMQLVESLPAVRRRKRVARAISSGADLLASLKQA